MTNRLPSSTTYGLWLAVVRILTGAIWLAHGIPKFTHSAEFMPSGPVDCTASVGASTQPIIASYICSGLLHTSGPYHQFVAQTVLPNMYLFAELVRLGEVLVGLALVLGALSRIGAVGGIVLLLNYLAARTSLLSSATLQSADFALLLLCAISVALPTGRVLGVDAFFARKKRAHTDTVRAEFVPEPPLDRPSAPPTV